MERPDGVDEVEEIWQLCNSGYRELLTDEEFEFVERMYRRYEKVEDDFDVSYTPAEVGRLMFLHEKLVDADLDFEDFDDEEIDFIPDEDFDDDGESQ